MLLFAHAGLTLGAATVLNKIKPQKHSSLANNKSSTNVSPSNPWQTVSSGFVSLANRVDIRLVLIGSLLPDIIDKPVGQVFFEDTFSNGRIISHTLLFLFIMTLAGTYLYRSKRQNWLLVLSCGSAMHLILDQMWLAPKTLFWPLYGFAFPKIELTDWFPHLFESLHTELDVLVPELLGAIVILVFVVVLYQRHKIISFLRRGQI